MTTIAHVNSEREFSGGEVQMFLLMEGLRARGHRALLVAPPGSAAAAEAVRRAFTVLPLAMPNDLALPAVFALVRKLRAEHAHLMHLHTGRAAWLGGIAARLSGLPAVCTRRMDRRVRRGLRTRLVYGSWIAHTVAISPAVERCLLEPGVPAERISVIWEAVDPDAFGPNRSTQDLRAAEGLDPGTPLLLVMAALVRRKGLDVLIAALDRLRARDFVLWIAGDGPEREPLEAQVRAADLADRIRFLGRRADKVELLAAADVFVLPSRREGLGVASLEAMASGVPVVASRVGGLGEAVVDGETGLLVPPEDPAALAAALERLLDDAALRATLGAGGRRRVLEVFSADTMVDKHVALYERLLAGAEREQPALD